jgi:hypothetical protein
MRPHAGRAAQSRKSKACALLRPPGNHEADLRMPIFRPRRRIENGWEGSLILSPIWTFRMPNNQVLREVR